MPEETTQTTATTTDTTQQTQASTAATATDYKFEFKDPEIRESFGKMFPGMKSVEDLAKTAIHQQRKIGQQGLPAPSGKPEEFPAWAQTHLKAPKDGKSFDFKDVKLPAGMKLEESGIGEFADHFAKAGLTNLQAKQILEPFFERAEQEKAKGLSARNELAATSKATLEKKWGTDYQKKMNGAEMALTTLGGPELVKIATEAGLTNHHQFVEFLANASELMKEDPATGKLSNNGFAAGPQQAAQEIDLLYANKEFMASYNNANDPGHTVARDRMRRLFQIKNGELGRK